MSCAMEAVHLADCKILPRGPFHTADLGLGIGQHGKMLTDKNAYPMAMCGGVPSIQAGNPQKLIVKNMPCLASIYLLISLDTSFRNTKIQFADSGS